MTKIVSGAVSSLTELGRDEAWMQGWLRDQPSRLGLGELAVSDGAAEDDRSFAATDDDRCFSVDVQLGELEPSRGFGVLDNWARNRVRHPDKTHVAVLVTETLSDRYRTTLETLAEHLPLVVVELAVWKGESEAIVVPHVALRSEAVDLAGTPAQKAAEAVPRDEAGSATEAQAAGEIADAEADEAAEATAEAEETEAEAAVDDEPVDKDDTGVADPWGLPRDDAGEGSLRASGNGSTGLLTKVS